VQAGLGVLVCCILKRCALSVECPTRSLVWWVFPDFDPNEKCAGGDGEPNLCQTRRANSGRDWVVCKGSGRVFQSRMVAGINDL